MKRKVVKVEYRKESESFPDWLKYEITLLSENGDEQVVPAYGKDLQDALSRVVHDNRVEVIQSKTGKIPWWVWGIMYFAYMLFISIWATSTDRLEIILFGTIFTIGLMVGINWLITKRNKDKVNL